MKCEIAGCVVKATWEVGKHSRRKKVCARCRDELIVIFGWELRRSLFNKHREASHG